MAPAALSHSITEPHRVITGLAIFAGVAVITRGRDLVLPRPAELVLPGLAVELPEHRREVGAGQAGQPEPVVPEGRRLGYMI